MNLCPFVPEKLSVFRHEQFCPPDLTVGDRADDLDDPAGGQVDLDDRARLRDMHVRRRVVERVDPNREPAFSNQARHSYDT